jgi:signal transduction histidine kinase/CheY-like chemotaxis protein
VQHTFTIILLYLTIAFGTEAIAQPLAIRGVLDLRNQEVNENTALELNGEWRFYWQKLARTSNELRELPMIVQLPHIWPEDISLDSKGFGTYSLEVLLPNNHSGLSLEIPLIYTAYSLFINGQEVASGGNVGTNSSSHAPNWNQSVIPLNIAPGRDRIEILLQVSNFSHYRGGIAEPFKIGHQNKLNRERELALAQQFFAFSAFVIAGIFFLALFYFGHSEKSIIFFSLFCLFYGLRIISTGLYPILIMIPSLPWWLVIRFEYISFYFAAISFGLFIYNLFPELSLKGVIITFTGTFLFFIVTTVLLPASLFTSFIDYYIAVIALYSVYLTYVTYTGVRQNKSGALFIFLGISFMFLIVALEILSYYEILTVAGWIPGLGYVAFLAFLSLTISNRFVYLFNEAKLKAESASIAKTHFLSTMGHELRTPLNAVIGLSELLLDSKSEHEKTQFAKTIKRSGENLLGIINNILDFTKIESDEVQYDYQPTHIPTLLADTIKMLGSLVDPKKVNLSFRFDDSLSNYLVVDQARLQQIIINLVGNAIKFTQEGEISIQVTTTESIAEKDQILFIVKDTGIGIPEEKMGLLFDRFSQLDADRSRKYQGTGLGLAISKRLIEAMGGRIWVQSKPDVGTTFYFTLVAKEASGSDLRNGEKAPTETEKLLTKELDILVVEDNIINQKVVIKVLERLGYTADIAVNGFEAIRKVKEHTYDLIFMDMEMPEMDGIEATFRIKTLPDLKKQPIIVAMTANATTEDKTRCFEAGMKDFIAKPITLQTTENVLLKWFSYK